VADARVSKFHPALSGRGFAQHNWQILSVPLICEPPFTVVISVVCETPAVADDCVVPSFINVEPRGASQITTSAGFTGPCAARQQWKRALQTMFGAWMKS
jgi:hypothetical protein